MQYRILDRIALSYKDGGYAPDWYIDNDYINSNNSTIDIVAPATHARVGDVIFLIESSGPYDKGVVTAIDNESLRISYRGDKELFNDNILNPLSSEFESDTDINVAGVFNLDVISEIMSIYWGQNIDIYKRIPMTIQTAGSASIYWTWQETQINFVEWLISLFKEYSIVVSFSIDFDIAEDTLDNRSAKYIITIAAVNNDNDIIKDNVSTQKITYTKESLPEKTCCWVVDKTTKEVITVVSGKNIFDKTFGYADSVLDGDNGRVYSSEYSSIQQKSNVSSYISISGSTDYVLSWTNGDSILRNIAFYNAQGSVIEFEDDGVIKTHLSYNGESGSFTFNTPSTAKKIRICYATSARNIQLERGTIPTAYETYSYKAIYYLCVNSSGEYYITPNSEDENRILPVRTSYVEYDANSATENRAVEDIAASELKLNSLNHAIEIEIPRDSKMFDFELAKFGDRYKIITKNGTITSVYSGRKESSETDIITLLFGVGRLNFTDLIKDTLRERRYTKIYSKQV